MLNVGSLVESANLHKCGHGASITVFDHNYGESWDQWCRCDALRRNASIL